MSISLVKGQKVDLTKGNDGLKKVVFGLGWDTNKYDGNAPFDLDVSAFLTDANGKVTGEQDFIFYNIFFLCRIIATIMTSKIEIQMGNQNTGSGRNDTFIP